MTKVTDEMLMALADGELDADTAAEVTRAAGSDPVLLRRLEAMRQTRLAAKGAFGAVLEEPVPPRLLAAAGAGHPHRGERSWLGWPALALAAGTAMAAAAATFLVVAGGAPAPSLWPDGAALTAALDTTPTGSSAPAGGGMIEPIGTYPAGEATCRSFRFTPAGGEGAAWLAVACREAGGWQIEVVAADRSDGGFVPAADGATASLDAFLDATGAGAGLDPAEEAELMARGWQH